ncbi:MAG: YitT family protein [Armatimonadetes bacterium]|nr:YitT family protein [Candidatus Hippobium faecium]
MSDKKSFVNEKVDQAYRQYATEHFNNGIKSDIETAIGVFFGSVLIAVNMKLFLRSGNMIPAGFSGVAVLIQEIGASFFNTEIPFAPVSLLLNVFPAYLCYKTVGKRFTLFSCISVVLVALMTDFIPKETLSDDRLLIAIFGGIVSGFGSSLILNSGACSGGTDFLSMHFSVKKGINTFNTVFGCNCILILISGILFGMDSALYTVIYQFVCTKTVNFLYQRFAKKTLFIVTEKPQEVADVIMGSTHHTCTILNSAVGSYSGRHTHIVYTIVSASETATVRRLIKGTDPNCFINTMNSDSVTGLFYQRPIA